MEANESMHSGISISHIRVGGEAVGLLFAASTSYTFLVGIPMLRSFLVGAIAVGTVISIALRIFHKYKPTQLVTLDSNSLRSC